MMFDSHLERALCQDIVCIQYAYACLWLSAKLLKTRTKQPPRDKNLGSSWPLLWLGPSCVVWGKCRLEDKITHRTTHKRVEKKRDHLQWPTVSVWWRQIFSLSKVTSQNKKITTDLTILNKYSVLWFMQRKKKEVKLFQHIRLLWN